MKRTIVACLMVLGLFGCKKSTGPTPTGTPTTLEQRARDGIAGATGFISKAQSQYQTECSANPTMTTCVTINKSIDAQNLTITALKTYCGFKPTDPIETVCAPVASKADALNSALANLNQLINDVKGLVK
jgi:hypothetical protein